MESKDNKIYETIIILDGNLSNTEYEQNSIEFKKIIKNLPATKIKTEKLGKKRLAYAIHGRDEGLYLIFTYQTTKADTVFSLEKQLRINPNVLKFISIQAPDKIYTPDDNDPEDSNMSEQKIKKPVDIFDLIFGIE